MRKNFSSLLLALGVSASLSIFPAQAETTGKTGLKAILSHVREYHPGLKAARADLSRVQEQVNQAKSGWRPEVSASASATSSLTEPGSFGTNAGETAGLGLSVVQPLYRGGQTVSRTKEAKYFVAVQEETVKALERDVFLEAISSYIGLLRDSKVVKLRQQNIENLKNQLESEKVRFDLGENTITDVSQAKARLSAAKADLERAKGQLVNSEASYVRVVGNLAPDANDISLPVLAVQEHFGSLKTLEQALEEAYKIHPDIVLTRMTGEANAAQQRAIKGELYPSVSVVGQVQRTIRPIFATNEAFQDQSSIAIQADIPLYQAGDTRSRLKQARFDGNKIRMQVLDVERDIKQQVTTAWQNLAVAKAEVGARATQVEAESLALDGTREEFNLGGRTTLDVLDAEQDKLDADVALVTAKHDVVSAEFNLLAVTGQLTLEKIYDLLP